MPNPKECPFCHSDKIKKVENEKFNDLYYCESCNHRFREDPKVHDTAKAKHSAKWDRCVEHVRAQGNVESPEAVCTEQSYE